MPMPDSKKRANAAWNAKNKERYEVLGVNLYAGEKAEFVQTNRLDFVHFIPFRRSKNQQVQPKIVPAASFIRLNEQFESTR